MTESRTAGRPDYVGSLVDGVDDTIRYEQPTSGVGRWHGMEGGFYGTTRENDKRKMVLFYDGHEEGSPLSFYFELVYMLACFVCVRAFIRRCSHEGHGKKCICCAMMPHAR